MLSDEVRKLAPEVPWQKMIGMRHILVHDYFRSDAEIVWQVVEKELPPLKRALQDLLLRLESH